MFCLFCCFNLPRLGRLVLCLLCGHVFVTYTSRAIPKNILGLPFPSEKVIQVSFKFIHLIKSDVVSFFKPSALISKFY